MSGWVASCQWDNLLCSIILIPDDYTRTRRLYKTQKAKQEPTTMQEPNHHTRMKISFEGVCVTTVIPARVTLGSELHFLTPFQFLPSRIPESQILSLYVWLCDTRGSQLQESLESSHGRPQDPQGQPKGAKSAPRPQREPKGAPRHPNGNQSRSKVGKWSPMASHRDRRESHGIPKGAPRRPIRIHRHPDQPPQRPICYES